MNKQSLWSAERVEKEYNMITTSGSVQFSPGKESIKLIALSEVLWEMEKRGKESGKLETRASQWREA